MVLNEWKRARYQLNYPPLTIIKYLFVKKAQCIFFKNIFEKEVKAYIKIIWKSNDEENEMLPQCQPLFNQLDKNNFLNWRWGWLAGWYSITGTAYAVKKDSD